jgi:LPS export ABC transporter protein LptC
MRMSRGLNTLIVIAVVVGSALLGQEQWRRDSDEPVAGPAEQAGYSARNAEIIETGDDGRPLYRLNAAVITERPKDGSVQLDQVRMSYRGENSNQWSLTATEGTIRDNNEHVELMGDVKLMGVLAGTSDLAQVTTDRMSFDTVNEVVSTDEPVVLRIGRDEMHSTGMLARLKEQQLTLNSKVHGNFSSR